MIFQGSFYAKFFLLLLISKIEDAIQKRMFNPMQGNTASLRAYRPTRYILNIFKIQRILQIRSDDHSNHDAALEALEKMFYVQDAQIFQQ